MCFFFSFFFFLAQRKAANTHCLVDLDFPYARCSLPVLAAIIMSNQVRVGDTIELPLPQPEAWAETVAWVYTGEEELMTDKVRENVQYLGGRVP